MFTPEQKEMLKNFGSACYWHGEDTGDYDMNSIEDMLDELWQVFCPTMLAPDKGQAAVVKVESGSAPCG